MKKLHSIGRKIRLAKSALSLGMVLALTVGLSPTVSFAESLSASDLQIAIDGDTKDWDHIRKYVVDEDGFSQAAAFVTDDYLYVLRELSEVKGYGSDHLYIDADGNHKNGYCEVGIDFFFESSTLYKYTGEGGAWGWGGSVDKEYIISDDKTVAEFKIPLSALGSKVKKDDIYVHIGCVKTDWTSLVNFPAGDVSLEKVPTLSEAFIASDAPLISDFSFSTNGSLEAVTENTMQNGVVGFFNAFGGNGEYSYNFAASEEFGKDNAEFIIQGNKLIANKKLLTPGTYKIFVKVSSDIRSEKKAFSFEIAGQNPATPITSSIFSGADGEWFTVPYDYEENEGFSLYATKTEDKLFTMIKSEEEDLNTVNVYYIDTNDDTGYEFSNMPSVDYIVRDANLYPVIADNKLGKSLGSVWMDYYRKSTQMQVYLSQIGNPDEVRISWRGASGLYPVPSETYLNVTASFDLGKEAGFYYPKENFDSFSNPYKGWVGWAGAFAPNSDEPSVAVKHQNGAYSFDRKTVYLAVRWSEYEPEEGRFNFEGIRKKYNLDYWKSVGARINLRFVMDNPEALKDGEETRMDIPNWLYRVLCDEANKGKIENPGTFYNNEKDLGGAGFSPNYESKLLIKYHDKAIKQLAKDFDKNDLTAFVMVGSLGHWAEMHTWPEGTGEFPNPSVCAEYMKSYTDYFHNVKIGVRKPYPYAAKNNFGLFNDIFGTSQYAGTYTYLDYINKGDTDMPGATAKEVKESAMPDFWKTNYSGGEFAEGNIKLHITNEGIIGCLEQVKDTHVSWLGPCSPADLETNEIYSSVYKANVLALQKKMGYNFFLEKISEVSNITAGVDTPINMTWVNEGVAPFYYSWPLEFSLIDAQGNVSGKTVVNGGIENWMPGRTNVNVNLKFNNAVKAGTYTLAVAILDKDSKTPSIKLAIEGGRSDLRYPLYTVNLSSTGVADPESSGHAVNEDAQSSSNESTSSQTQTQASVNVAQNATVTGVTVNAGVTAGIAQNAEETAPQTVEDTKEETIETVSNEQREITDNETALASGDFAEETPSPEAVATANQSFVGIIIALAMAALLVLGFFVYKKALVKGGSKDE